MKTLPWCIVSCIIFPIYETAAHPGLAVGLVASFGASGPFVLVGVIIFAIGFPVEIALVEHYKSYQRPSPIPAAEPPERPIHVNTPTADTSSDSINHNGTTPISNTYC